MPNISPTEHPTLPKNAMPAAPQALGGGGTIRGFLEARSPLCARAAGGGTGGGVGTPEDLGLS
jgi:hypothetical protein